MKTQFSEAQEFSFDLCQKIYDMTQKEIEEAETVIGWLEDLGVSYHKELESYILDVLSNNFVDDGDDLRPYFRERFSFDPNVANAESYFQFVSLAQMFKSYADEQDIVIN